MKIQTLFSKAAFPVLILVVVSACSRQFTPLFDKAQAKFAESEYVEAVDALNLAIPLWRESDGVEEKAQAYALLGKSYHRLRKFEQAVEAYNQAIKLSTNTFEAAYSLGVVYLASSRPKKALPTFERALRMKPDDPQTLLALGDCYYLAKDFADAKRFYQRVLDVSPGVKSALENLALIESKAKTRPRPPALTPQKKSRRR